MNCERQLKSRDMTRRIRYAALLGALFLAAACQREEWPADGGMSASDGYVTLRAGVEIPSMPEVVTRSVDPDGLDVQTMTLFCFDSYGLFISTADAELDRQGFDGYYLIEYEAEWDNPLPSVVKCYEYLKKN